MKRKNVVMVVMVSLIAVGGVLWLGLNGAEGSDGPRLFFGFGSSSSQAYEDPSKMERFDSDEEMAAYMTEILRREEERRAQYEEDGDYMMVQESAEPMAASADSEAPANEEITNVQEAGVSEGGIVMNVGDHLVMLRRGRLYTVDVAHSGEARAIDSMRVAPTEELNSRVWYDEMLVRGDRIYVVGYRFGARIFDGDRRRGNFSGATEITSFTIDKEGALSRGKSTFFESHDYFSGSNYASRLVDGQLIFYMPYRNLRASMDEPIPQFPRFLEYEGGNRFAATEPIFEATDVVRPVEMPERPTFHTVMRCDLPDDMSLDCEATSLLSGWGREFYVSPKRVFLWSGDHVLAISQSDGTAKAHAVHGRPINQFSFSERDGSLRVAVTGGRRGLELLDLPLSDFDRYGQQSVSERATLITGKVRGGWGLQNRHVDGWYLAGSQEGLFAHHIESQTTKHFPVDERLDGHGARVSRIEAAPGIGAIVAYEDRSRQGDLVLNTLRLGRSAEIVSGTTMENMAIGESRSHGFFFRPDEQGGTFGLPVIGSSGGWWGSGASNIAFFRADRGGDIDLRGTISSSTDAGGTCETSCIDWYGNTRPIFLRDRVYALMGSEFVEVEITEEDAREKGTRVMLGDKRSDRAGLLLD